MALFERGRHREALARGTALAERYPDAPPILTILGAVNAVMGRLDAAAACLTKALRLDPDDAEAHNSLGNVLSELGQPEQAMASYARALRLNPDYAEAHNNLGKFLNDLGKHEQAVASYARALRLRPDYAEAHYNLAIALGELGRHDEAVASFTKALRIKPDYAKVYENLGRIRKYHKDDPRIARMRALLADRAIGESDTMLLGFALGKAHDDIGDAETAFQHFLEGNRLRKKQLGYDIASDRRLFRRIKSIFSEDESPTVEEIEPAAGGRKQPIFIVGMHRSGTTLVEQILSSHSQVHGADEIHAMNRIVAPLTLDVDNAHHGRLTGDLIRHIRIEYLTELDNLGDGEPRVTDKMPLNFRWIGFILTAMPEARIVNLQRDPVATCWSVFKQYISNDSVGYAYDLVDIAEYYKLYIGLMDFWRGKFPNRIYDLDYEALTENQEEETRKLLEYCNLDWEAQCLEFHKTERAVRTPSSVQVRQAIYQGSSQAWRKYETQLQPMLRVLEG
ncbi:MAG: tetratricopeptide repeat protein [Proteobacteria bacterium]|nr:tetratricopeptide repeat protein [Pseudomonadota bacterium]